MGLFSKLFGSTETDEEIRKLIVEYPSGNQYSVMGNVKNVQEEYESQDYEVVSDEPYTYKEPGLFGRLFGGK